MYKAKEEINIQKELKHLIEYTQKRWNDNGDLSKIITTIWNSVEPLTVNMFSQYGFFEVSEQWSKERQESSKWDNNLSKHEKDLIYIYDAIHSFLRDFSSSANRLYDISMKKWNYEKIVKKITSDIQDEFKNTSDIKPLGWEELAKNYTDYDGMDEYSRKSQLKEEKAFKGCDSSGHTSFGFPGRIALPYVMYDDKCQNRKPLEVLVGAVLAHVFFVNTHNNTLKIMENLNEMKKEWDKDIYFTKIQHRLDINSLTDNNIIKAIYSLKNKHVENQTPEEFKKTLKENIQSKIDFDALSPKEKSARVAKNQAYISKMMSSLMDATKDGYVPKPQDKEEEQREEKEADIAMKILNDKKKIKP